MISLEPWTDRIIKPLAVMRASDVGQYSGYSPMVSACADYCQSCQRCTTVRANLSWKSLLRCSNGKPQSLSAGCKGCMSAASVQLSEVKGHSQSSSAWFRTKSCGKRVCIVCMRGMRCATKELTLTEQPWATPAVATNGSSSQRPERRQVWECPVVVFPMMFHTQIAIPN